MKNVFLLSHTTGKYAGLDSLEEFLLREGHNVDKLLHPLDDYSQVKTSFSSNGQELEAKTRRNRGLFNYVEDFSLSLRQVQKSNIEIFIGASNFDTLPAIICRKLLRKKIPRIIYYPRDFAEDRFNSKLLNFVYVFVEKTVIKFSDVVISNTERAKHKRQQLGLESHKSIVIPNGVYLKEPNFKKKEINKYNFVYVGNVTKEHGVHDLIRTLKPIIKKLTIIGAGGDDFDRTKEMCKKEQIPLELHAKKNHDFVIEYLRNFGGFGLAPYNASSKWTYYCSPLKVSEYIANGVPVIVSALPEIAGYVKDHQLGIVYEKNQKLDELKKLLEHFDTADFHQKAEKFYESYNSIYLYKRVPL